LLGEELILVQITSNNIISIDDSGMYICKRYRAKRPRLYVILRRIITRLCGEIPTVYARPADRCRFEREMLEFWALNDLHAPKYVCSPNSKTIIMTCLEGSALSDYLSEKPSEALSIFKLLLVEISGRHELTISRNDLRYLHRDCNYRNLFLVRKEGHFTFFHIDFEEPFLDVALEEAMEREMSKLVVQQANLVTVEDTSQALLAYYRDHHLLREFATQWTKRKGRFLGDIGQYLVSKLSQ